MKTFAIIPGFSEGRWHARQLSRELVAAGFRRAKVKDADIIITHSGGAYLLPRNAEPKLLLMVGANFMPFLALPMALAGKVAADFRAYRDQKRAGQWLLKFLFNAIYFFRLDRTARMLGSFKKRNISDTWKGHRVIVLRNQDDIFCQPHVHEADPLKAPEVCFVSVTGHHDDIWTNPKPYVNLLKSLV